MQSGSHPTSRWGRPAHIGANIVGTIIALLTLVLPLWVIACYTTTSPPIVKPVVATEPVE
ncbi:MAG: hypothetical protein LH702_09075 [Phormidesmis sp. CAN_BIN44]|nr:hypothetical protein [Phormidesmis sp. CAN_BIN44]